MKLSDLKRIVNRLSDEELEQPFLIALNSTYSIHINKYTIAKYLDMPEYEPTQIIFSHHPESVEVR